MPSPRYTKGDPRYHPHVEPSDPAAPPENPETQSPPPRQKPGNGLSALSLLNGDTPWWAKFTIVILFYFGLPTLIVGLLLAMGAGWIPSPITDTHKIAADLKVHMTNAERRDERMIRFLAFVCRNTSYTEAQRAECERIVQMDIR